MTTKKDTTKFTLKHIPNNSTIYSSLNINILMVTEDNLRNRLAKFREALSYKYSWGIPLSFVVSIVITLSTSQFNDAFIFSKDLWNAVFVVALFVNLVWLTVSVFKAIKHRNETTIGFIIENLKKESSQLNKVSKN